MASCRRVVITGIGLVTPLGIGKDKVWGRLINADHGIFKLTDERFACIPSRIAGLIPKEDLEQYKLGNQPKFIEYALLAAKLGLDDSELNLEQMDSERIGVSFGSSMSCVEEIQKQSNILATRGIRKVSPHFVPRILGNMAAGLISIKFGLRGPIFSPNSACATGASSVGDAFRAIKYGESDLMIAGAAESCIDPLSMAGFCQARALTTRHNDHPELASRPFDKDRSGFVMGEGAAVLILENLESAKLRNAPILCEIVGYGSSADAHHITAPHPYGLGAQLAMKRALGEGQMSANEVDYINAHATSTPLGDCIELKAIQPIFNHDIHVSSTKGATGHLLSASGAVEAAFTALSIANGQVPPNRNFDSTEVDISSSIMISRDGISKRIRIALSNSFGFGGMNVSLCFRSLSCT